MIVGTTGHRVVLQEPGELLRFARLSVARMVLDGATEIITGMALGWDLAVAEAADQHGIPFCAAVPYPQQADRWPAADRARWERLLGRAARIDVGGQLPLTHLLHKRNHWIVGQCEELWAFWNGSPGGTGNCVLYAAKTGRSMVPLWDDWIRFRAERT